MRKKLNTEELKNELKKFKGQKLCVATEYLESSIELYMPEAYYLDDVDVVDADEGFGRDYSLAFYINNTRFGIPFRNIESAELSEVEGRAWVTFKIVLSNGDVYRFGNATD